MRLLVLVLCMVAAAAQARADSGVLLPRDQDHPDPAVLSLKEMTVKVTIDNGDARVFITQIFANHTRRIEEGTYGLRAAGGEHGLGLCNVGRAGADSGGDPRAQAGGGDL
jgi:hypothetical protein